MGNETALAGSIVTAVVLAAIAMFAPTVLPGMAVVFLAEYAAVGVGSAIVYHVLSE
jgi:hypothetical protein